MDKDELLRQARERNAALSAEVESLKAQIAGDPSAAASWLQVKVYRQRLALDRLCRKVTSQRFRLRLLNELGRDVSREEYDEAKAKLGYADRVDEYEVLV